MIKKDKHRVKSSQGRKGGKLTPMASRSENPRKKGGRLKEGKDDHEESDIKNPSRNATRKRQGTTRPETRKTLRRRRSPMDASEKGRRPRSAKGERTSPGGGTERRTGRLTVSRKKNENWARSVKWRKGTVKSDLSLPGDLREGGPGA